MMEEKWKELYCYEVFNDGEWSIYLKTRCNPHEGEPTMKVWVCQFGREAAQFSNKYRGYGRFMNHEELLPGPVRKKAKKTWNELCEGRYTPEKLAELREQFIAAHTRNGQVSPLITA